MSESAPLPLVDAENRLVERLPQIDRTRLLALCVPVRLARAEVLCEPGQPSSHVYFPIDGIVSLLSRQEGRAALEVGMVGREGMVGIELALGAPLASLHATVQAAGAAWRIGAQAFRGELGRSSALRRELHRYVHVLMSQLATSAACIHFHEIGPRLARWLLMTQDRAHSPSLQVTHEHLATMLGVRRVGITQAACALQVAGVIEYRRGELTVRDRARLEAASCACYATDRQSYFGFDPEPVLALAADQVA
jgi:CRP-like cAMP-binding protein